jgi:predicted PurR-regulated permease PerM
MAILSLLPVGGTAIVWLPGAIYLWVAGRHGSAIFLLAWGVVVASFLADNVLRPLLIRGTEELSTLVVFLGVFGGLAAFGLLGIFIGPVALVLATTLIQVMRQAAQTAEPASQA